MNCHEISSIVMSLGVTIAVAHGHLKSLHMRWHPAQNIKGFCGRSVPRRQHDTSTLHTVYWGHECVYRHKDH